MTAVTVKELKEILATTKAPRKLCDPVTELPLWDEDLMTKVKNAKNKEELKSVDAEIRKCMVILIICFLILVEIPTDIPIRIIEGFRCHLLS